MAANLKLGVDLTSFKQGINDAKAQLKSFDAQIKFAETSFKKTGDAEAAMSTKTDALTNKLKTQKQMIQQYDKTLQALRKSGIDPASESYQKMQAAMLNVQSAANETEIALNGLSTSQLTAASSADKLTQSVGNIGKKMSLDQVISGIGKITDGLEGAARKAETFAKALWGGVTESAERADDIATMAAILGLDIESYQRYKKTFDSFADITVKDWETAKNKIQSAVVKPSNEQLDIFAALGIGIRNVDGNVSPYYNRYVIGKAREWEDVFWDIGQALRNKVASKELTQDEADVYAKAIFGKSWDSLNPIFNLGREGFYDRYNNQQVTSEESINRLASLNDQLVKLKGDFKSLQDEVLAGLAPALQKGAEVLDSLLGKLMEYLQKPEGQQMLDQMGKAVEGLFSNLSSIEPDKVIEGFVGVFDKIINGFKWLEKNKDSIIQALEAIVIGWAGLKLTGGALEIMKLINGVKDFQGVPTAPPQNVTSGNGEVIATGNTGGGWLSPLLSTLVSGMPTQAVLNDTFELLRRGKEQLEEYRKATQGMNATDANAYTLKMGFGISDEEAKDLANKMNPPEVTVKTVPEENAAEKIAQDVGKVILPAELRIMGGWIGLGGGGEMLSLFSRNNKAVYSNANGINFVPYDGYLSLLHKGERVVPAREVNSSHNFSSNLYVESMYMNNGQDADGLAAAIAAANRRTMSGYGS